MESFPANFEIGPADAMMTGRPFSGPIRISARLDSDGDPMTRSPGDLSAEVSEALKPGARGVELILRPTAS
jgi:hypothetical protein